MSFDEEYLKAGFSVDNVIFGFHEKALKVLLIKRGAEPFINYWGLPGALVNPDEDLDNAPVRILDELTGINDVYLEQVATFGKVNRHPMGRVMTVAYYSLVNVEKLQPRPNSFATEVSWSKVDNIEDLAFDHLEILTKCLQRLQDRLRNKPIGFELLPEKFTLSDLQSLYEAVLGKSLDKRNFRKKILSMKLLFDHNEFQKGVAHRPAKLYSFDRDQYDNLLSKGFVFEL